MESPSLWYCRHTNSKLQHISYILLKPESYIVGCENKSQCLYISSHTFNLMNINVLTVQTWKMISQAISSSKLINEFSILDLACDCQISCSELTTMTTFFNEGRFNILLGSTNSHFFGTTTIFRILLYDKWCLVTASILDQSIPWL